MEVTVAAAGVVQPAVEPPQSEIIKQSLAPAVEPPAQNEPPAVNQNPSEPPVAEKTYTQEEVTKLIQERVKNKDAELDSIKTQLTQTAASVEPTTQKLSQLERENAVLKVGLETHLPSDVLETIKGDTYDEILANANKIKAIASAASPALSFAQQQASAPKQSIGDVLVQGLALQD